MTQFFDDMQETWKELALWIRDFPQRSHIARKSERWLIWIAMGFLALVYTLAWLG